jgi:peptidoglycan/LPS O-acetylase OafA/YrhL
MLSANPEALSLSDKSVRIDALRGCAIFTVLQYHYGSCFGVYSELGAPALLRSFLGSGWAGVDLFFVLSAFLLTRNLLTRRGEAGATLYFYRRRMLRILPLYLLLLAAAATLIPVLGTGEETAGAWLFGGLAPAWTYATFTQNFWFGLQPGWQGHFLAPTWSLAVEEHFYLLLPLIVLRLDDNRLRRVALALIVAGPLLRLGILHTEGLTEITVRVWSIARVDSFGWGMFLALTLSRGPADDQRFTPRSVITTVLISLIFFVVARDDLALLYSFTAFLAAFLTCVAALPDAAPPRGGLFLAGADWMGQRCYSLYLLHMPVAGLTALAFGNATPLATEPRSLLAILVALVVTLFLSNLTYRFIERPFIAYGARLTADARTARA